MKLCVPPKLLDSFKGVSFFERGAPSSAALLWLRLVVEPEGPLSLELLGPAALGLRRGGAGVLHVG